MSNLAAFVLAAVGVWIALELRLIARKLFQIDVELQLRRADRDSEHRARLRIRDHTEAIRNHLTHPPHREDPR